MTNHNCFKCNTYNAQYLVLAEDAGCYMCIDCGRGWGGYLEGNSLNKAYFLVRRAVLEMDISRTEVYDSDIVCARDIALDNLEAIARALKANQNLRKLPNNPQWWIQYQSEIEAQLLVIKNMDTGGVNT